MGGILLRMTTLVSHMPNKLNLREVFLILGVEVLSSERRVCFHDGLFCLFESLIMW